MDKNEAVAKIMTKKVVVADPDKHRFSQVRQLFIKYNVHHLPVADKTGKVAGIISSHDILNAYQEITKRIKVFDDKILDNEIKLKDIMTKNPMTVPPGESIINVTKLFAKNKFHALPIVEKGKLVGLVTSNDLIKFLLD